MTRNLATLLALTFIAFGCGHAPDVDAGPVDSGFHDSGTQVVDSGPCSQGLGCGETPPPSQCSSVEDGGCTNDYGCYCAMHSDGTCAWEILPTCDSDAGAGDAGEAGRG